MKDNTKTGTASCDHAPTTVVVIPKKHGYQVKCLRCGTLGPEQRDPARAWAALRGLRATKSRTP